MCIGNAVPAGADCVAVFSLQQARSLLVMNCSRRAGGETGVLAMCRA